MKKILFIFISMLFFITGRAQYNLNDNFFAEAEFIKREIVEDLDAVIMKKMDNGVIEIILLDDYYSFTLVKSKMRGLIKRLDPVLRLLQGPWEYTGNNGFTNVLNFMDKNKMLFKLNLLYIEIEGNKYLSFFLSTLDPSYFITDTLQIDTTNLKIIDK